MLTFSISPKKKISFLHYQSTGAVLGYIVWIPLYQCVLKVCLFQKIYFCKIVYVAVYLLLFCTSYHLNHKEKIDF